MEEWKICQRNSKYAVSNLGNIKNIKKDKKLTASISTNGYRQVNIKPSTNISALVAEVFLGKRPEGSEIHHKDRVKTNDRLDNLEYLPMIMNRGKNDINGISACQICKTRINNNRKTCSRECQSIYSHITLVCEYCYKEFTIWKSQLNARKRNSTHFYCSRECSYKRNRSKSVKS
jgi:hypothetical protein